MNVTVHILLFKCILLAIKTEIGNIMDRWKRTAFSFQSLDDFIRYPCPLFRDHFNKPAAVALQVNFPFSIQTSEFVLRYPEHSHPPPPRSQADFSELTTIHTQPRMSSIMDLRRNPRQRLQKPTTICRRRRGRSAL